MAISGSDCIKEQQIQEPTIKVSSTVRLDLVHYYTDSVKPVIKVSSAEIVTMFIIGAIFIAAFVIRELTMRAPMLNLEVLKSSTFTLTTIINMVVMMSLFGGMILLPSTYKIYVVSQHLIQDCYYFLVH